jgi:Skp family chaperone for outer membrane proteins
MKAIRTTFFAAAFAATAALTASAQTQPAARPAAPAAAPAANANVPDGKIAIIDTSAFDDPKSGIKRMIAASDAIEREFKPRRDEIATLKTRYDALVKEINDTQKVAAPAALQAKADQAEALKTEIERKQQDGQKALERRFGELMAPINQDLGNALQAFATARGITIVFDVSKTGNALMVVNNAVDITAAFIAEYNQRNPATASTGTPATRP